MAFAYESSVGDLKRALVPDPVSLPEWKELLDGWLDQGQSCSLLRWIIVHSAVGPAIPAILASHMGVRWIGPCPDPLEATSADARLLCSHGFVPLPGAGQKHRVTGGPVLAPCLRDYLGDRAAQWEWVLTSPEDGMPIRRGIEDNRSPNNNYTIARWLRETLHGLRSRGASDIHFEIHREVLTIRIHHNSRMEVMGQWKDGRAGLVSRLLCGWAGLPSRHRDQPLDGILILGEGPDPVEMRLSRIATIEGESIVLRVPGMISRKRSLGELGMPAQFQESLLEAATMEPGLILVTGATGSGKTTTLYALLRALEPANLKILTIEDPVERILPFAVQSNVDEPAGWTFDKAIRSYLRQDPDVIMIGEIRDAASAQAACRAALTGHAVLASLHARNSGAISARLAGYGVPSGIIDDALRIAVHQEMQRGEGNKAQVKFTRMQPAAT